MFMKVDEKQLGKCYIMIVLYGYFDYVLQKPKYSCPQRLRGVYVSSV
jgi:hypothetical protein